VRLRKTCAAVSAIALLASAAVRAAEGELFPHPPEGMLDLRFVGEGGNGEYMFVDLSTAFGERAALTTWVLQIFNPPMENPVADIGARWTRWIYNCDTASAEPDSDAYLNTSYVLFGGVVPRPGTVTLPPQSLGYAALDAVCNGVYIYPEGRSFVTVADAATVVDAIVALPPP
jgi:hypothetical protein